MKNRFLITGLPRTRSTWLTVLLNCTGVDAVHERNVHFNSMDEVAKWLDGGTVQEPRGLVDGFASIQYPRWALEQFKDAPVVIIDRNPSDVLASWKRWSGGAAKDTAAYLDNYSKFVDALSDPLIVPYEKLDDYATVFSLVSFVTGGQIALPRSLFDFLNATKVELIPAKTYEWAQKNPKPFIKEMERL